MSKLTDHDPEIMCIRYMYRAPDLLEKLCLSNDTPRMLSEHGEHSVFLGCEFDRVAGECHPSCLEVYDQLTRLQTSRNIYFVDNATLTQYCSNSSEKFLNAKWFSDVVIGTRIEACDLFIL
ncbi:hypothetical protein KP05_13970 [Cobetia amphilecti]|nr:hypothetical protein KP05_13970 [Cobetia amphilecti]